MWSWFAIHKAYITLMFSPTCLADGITDSLVLYLARPQMSTSSM
jgi:hypothetical protein